MKTWKNILTIGLCVALGAYHDTAGNEVHQVSGNSKDFGLPSRVQEAPSASLFIPPLTANPEQGKVKTHSNSGNRYFFDDGERSFEDMLKAAEDGDPRFQTILGLCYEDELNLGVDKDLPEAAKWFRKAAAQGVAEAQFRLGKCYFNGSGVNKDVSQAVTWFRKAAEQGDVAAQIALGRCYDQGLGVGEDHREAVKWFRKAAEQGDAESQANMGLFEIKGESGVTNLAEAVSWFQKAAEQGHAVAQLNLGLCYDRGDGVMKDAVQAYKWFSLGAAQYPSAGKRLRDMADGMSKEQVAEARILVDGFEPKHSKRSRAEPEVNTGRLGIESKRVKEEGGNGKEPRDIMPACSAQLSGPNEVRIRNPNDFEVRAAIRAGEHGKNCSVPAHGVSSIFVPDGTYAIFFVYSNRPDALFQGDSFTVKGNGVEIQIVQVVNGNYGIKQVK